MKVKLEDVCERGTSDLKQTDVDAKGIYPLYGASGYIGNIGFYHQSKPYVAVIKDGAGIGRTSLHPSMSSVIGTMQYLIPKSNIMTEYLYYVVKHMHLDKYYTGATIPHIYFKDYKSEKFNLETLEKQSLIVDILGKCEKIISCRQKELLSLEELIKARFVEMFGDTVTNPLEWEEHNLDEYIKFLTSGSRGWSKYFVNKKSSIFITIKNVKNKHVSLDNIQYIDAPKNKEAERTKVKAGDLLISITADLGRTAVIDEDIASKGGYINQHLSLIRLDTTRLNPLYAAYFLETPGGKIQFESKNQTGVKAGINFDSIRSLKILVPPLCLQESYLDFVKQVDKSKVVVQAALDKAQMLFDSLMQEYFG